MKKLLVVSIAALFVSVASVMAAVPHMINYQGYLTDTDGEPLDTTVAMSFAFYDAAVNGAQLWTETQPTCTVRAGLFSALLGSVNAIPNSVFADTNVWLGIAVGGNSEMSPRTRVVSVAYSYRVGTVDGASGGTISGKVNIGLDNTNEGNYAFVVGQGNDASGDYSTVSGGYSNIADVQYATVAGGESNYVEGWWGVAGGGFGNTPGGNFSVVGGGRNNQANGEYSLVGCGRNNRARGDFSVVAGGGGLSMADSNSAIGNYSAIGGGKNNVASGYQASVGGGNGNTAGGENATVGGGYGNVASDEGTTVGGGYGNAASDMGATVAGGWNNVATNESATVGGGSANTASGGAATVSGGVSNGATGHYGTVSGGYGNTDSSLSHGTIGGGNTNWVSSYYPTVGGGHHNEAHGYAATVGGGRYNNATGGSAVISGGYTNDASGSYSMVCGGHSNSAGGDYSFAAGRRAKANFDGCFRWADSYNADFSYPDTANSFAVRATGGVYLFTNSSLTSGSKLYAGSSAWTAVSDSTKKRNIRLVDTGEILDKVAQLPVRQWSYKSQDPSIEHIGPMAQDFWKLFHLGEDSLAISTIDPDGIALAAIQELQKQNEELRTAVRRYAEELNDLRTLVERMAANSITIPAGLGPRLGEERVSAVQPPHSFQTLENKP